MFGQKCSSLNRRWLGACVGVGGGGVTLSRVSTCPSRLPTPLLSARLVSETYTFVDSFQPESV